MRRFVLTLAILGSLTFSLRAAEPVTRADQVRGDKTDVEDTGLWIYNDLEKGIAEAKSTNTHMIVPMRNLMLLLLCIIEWRAGDLSDHGEELTQPYSRWRSPLRRPVS
mgnify:CR=1 FL=1